MFSGVSCSPLAELLFVANKLLTNHCRPAAERRTCDIVRTVLKSVHSIGRGKLTANMLTSSLPICSSCFAR